MHTKLSAKRTPIPVLDEAGNYARRLFASSEPVFLVGPAGDIVIGVSGGKGEYCVAKHEPDGTLTVGGVIFREREREHAREREGTRERERERARERKRERQAITFDSNFIL